MRTLIVYATYYESTEKCAFKIKEKFQNPQIVNLSFGEVKFLKDYDTIIIGTPVHAGKIHKSIKKFLNKYEKELSEKKLYLFYCGLDPNFLEKITEQFPGSLQNKILFKSHFGGEMIKSKLNGFEKMIMEMVEKKEKIDYTNYITIDQNKIDEFILKVQE